MDIHDEDQAAKFDTRQECKEWIDDRVVRFKLKMVKAQTRTPGEFTFVPQKFGGTIHCESAEGFKSSGTDEPLSNYAEPVKKDGKWMAVMKVRS